MLERDRPVLIRIVGALTELAITLQACAHVGIQTWLDARLFAASTQGPPPTEVAPNVWASEVGTAAPTAAVNLEALFHAANHYCFFLDILPLPLKPPKPPPPPPPPKPPPLPPQPPF